MNDPGNELKELLSSKNLEEGYILTLTSQALTAGGRTGANKGECVGFERTPLGKSMALGLKK